MQRNPIKHDGVQGQVLAVAVKSKRINRWSKRLSPHQPQADETIEPEFSILLVCWVYLLRR